MAMNRLSARQIGRCGELLVQYLLLKHGFESAPMTTDAGIDLVAFPNGVTIPEITSKPITIQVKATQYSDGGLPASEGLVWRVAKNCPADYYALVDIIEQKCWLFTKEEFERRSTSAGNGRRIGWNVHRKARGKLSRTAADFQEFEIDNVLLKLLESWSKAGLDVTLSGEEVIGLE